jgi:hypothetical protein
MNRKGAMEALVRGDARSDLLAAAAEGVRAHAHA